MPHRPKKKEKVLRKKGERVTSLSIPKKRSIVFKK